MSAFQNIEYQSNIKNIRIPAESLSVKLNNTNPTYFYCLGWIGIINLEIKSFKNNQI